MLEITTDPINLPAEVFKTKVIVRWLVAQYCIDIAAFTVCFFSYNLIWYFICSYQALWCTRSHSQSWDFTSH